MSQACQAALTRPYTKEVCFESNEFCCCAPSHGYDDTSNERVVGSNLSAGQRQLVSLARALLTPTNILGKQCLGAELMQKGERANMSYDSVG